jgi:DNA-binding transcriptional ArsR family regulator
MKMNPMEMEEKASLLKLLAHPIRLCILRGLIRDGENNVSFMQDCLDVAQSTLSQHLSKLRLAGIVKSERRGTEIFYSVANEEVVSIINLLFDLEEELN